MNLLNLMGKDTGELLAIAGEELLKDGCESFVLYKDKNGKFKSMPLKFNIVEKYEALMDRATLLQSELLLLKENGGHSE